MMPKLRQEVSRSLQWGTWLATGHRILTSDEVYSPTHISADGPQLRMVMIENPTGAIEPTYKYKWVMNDESDGVANESATQAVLEAEPNPVQPLIAEQSPSPVNSMAPHRQMLTRKQVQEKTGLSKTQLVRLDAQGTLLARKPPRATKNTHVRYYSDEVNAYINSYGVPPKAR